MTLPKSRCTFAPDSLRRKKKQKRERKKRRTRVDADSGKVKGSMDHNVVILRRSSLKIFAVRREKRERGC